MVQEQQIQPFGYSEMYEWKNHPDNIEYKNGLFVQFSKDEPEKIEKYNGGVLCGVTTVCFTVLSDNPAEWCGKSKTDSTGSYVREKKYIAVGSKVYDQSQELNIVRTFPYKIYKKVDTDEYDKEREYIPRINRIEWQAVTVTGKCIVQDDGTCKAGGFCTPLVSDDYSKAGLATKAKDDVDVTKFYVLKRLSENTILIKL